MSRPLEGEYPEYYNTYINLVKEGDILEIMSEQSTYFQGLLAGITEEKAGSSYAFGKWTIKEILGHLMDHERIMGVRALRIARGDRQPLPGYDQDDYVKNGQFFRRSLKELTDEMLIVRASTLYLFRTFDETTMMQRGTVNDFEITIRAIIYILAGHELYHINFLKENYI